MKINLNRLSQLENRYRSDSETQNILVPRLSETAFQILEECVRTYLHSDPENPVVIKLLKEYELLIEEETDIETHIVKPFRFTENG